MILPEGQFPQSVQACTEICRSAPQGKVLNCFPQLSQGSRAGRLRAWCASQNDTTHGKMQSQRA